MKYLIISFFNSTNIGDLLLSQQMSESLSTNVQLVKWDFATNQKVMLSDIRDNEEISKVPESHAILKTFKSFLTPIYSFLYMLFSPNWTCYKGALVDCDGIIIGGGNMLMDRTCIPQYSMLFYKYITIAKKKRKKVFVMDVGVGPIKTNFETLLIKKGILQSDYFSVRDKKSAYISSKSLVARDPAFFLNAIQVVNKENIIGISVIGNGKFLNCDYQAYISSMVSIILELQKKASIVLYSTEKMDYSSVNDICSSIDSDKISSVEISNINELIELYKHTKLIIGSRMHSLIVAMTQYIPTIAISWDNKVQSLYEMARLEDRLFNIKTIQNCKQQIIEESLKLIKQDIDDKAKAFVLDSKQVLNQEYSNVLGLITGGK